MLFFLTPLFFYVLSVRIKSTRRSLVISNNRIRQKSLFIEMFLLLIAVSVYSVILVVNYWLDK